jgi:hypothetical protein
LSSGEATRGLASSRILLFGQNERHANRVLCGDVATPLDFHAVVDMLRV